MGPLTKPTRDLACQENTRHRSSGGGVDFRGWAKQLIRAKQKMKKAATEELSENDDRVLLELANKKVGRSLGT